jgi:hypothetical protein
MSTKGFPELKRLYGLLGGADRVMLQRGEHFPHWSLLNPAVSTNF